MKLLLNIMVNVHIKTWYVIPISRCPDQASCDVYMKCVYYSSHAISMCQFDAKRCIADVTTLKSCVVMKS